MDQMNHWLIILLFSSTFLSGMDNTSKYHICYSRFMDDDYYQAKYMQDNQEKGFMLYSGPFHEMKPCYIHYMHVPEKYRNQKEGSTLFGDVVKKLQNQGCSTISFDAITTAVAFYEKQGADFDKDKPNGSLIPMVYEFDKTNEKNT